MSNLPEDEQRKDILQIWRELKNDNFVHFRYPSQQDEDWRERHTSRTIERLRTTEAERRRLTEQYTQDDVRTTELSIANGKGKLRM